jgi:hypothetical protein
MVLPVDFSTGVTLACVYFVYIKVYLMPYNISNMFALTDRKINK